MGTYNQSAKPMLRQVPLFFIQAPKFKHSGLKKLVLLHVVKGSE